MTTQYARASYQEIIDLHTETNKVSVLGIHTPTNETPYNMLSGFFDMFQKYHYDGCSFSLVPAARLPADISQVSYEGGQAPIDPRDLLNPILWHGCHGESLGAVLNQFYSGDPSTNLVSKDVADSVDVNKMTSTRDLGTQALMESLYYKALSDNSWAKAHPQRGFRKSGLRPLVYSISTDRQYMMSPYGTQYPFYYAGKDTGAVPGDPLTNRFTSGTLGSASGAIYVKGSEGVPFFEASDESNISLATPLTKTDSQFFTTKLHGLGWLDTRTRYVSGTGVTTSGFDGTDDDNSTVQAHYATIENLQKVNMLPRLFMGICLLPPAYLTEQYFRIVINHNFSFKKFRGVSMRGDFSGNCGAATAPEYFNFN